MRRWTHPMLGERRDQIRRYAQALDDQNTGFTMVLRLAAVGIRFVTLSALALTLLSITGCGGGAGASATDSTSAPTTVAPTAASTASRPTTQANGSSGKPELILCREETLDSPELLALSGNTDGASVTPLVSFSGADQTTTCSISPDLTKLAELSTTPEGSQVAGYISSGGGDFVNISGHEHNGYSGVPHTDEEPLFNPVTGELWWTSEGDIWSSALNAPMPEDHGPGRVGAFTTTGEPRAYQWFFSPDGSVEAFAKELEEIHYSQGLGVAIGSPSDVTASCESRAAQDPSPEGIGASDFLGACPGVARIAFGSICERFVGLISDSEFICIEGGSHRFYRVTFAINGKHVKILSHVSLTPSTTMEIGWAAISPDGKSLWYVATTGESTPESTEQTKLYIVPTSAATPEPSAESVSPESSLAAASPKGWRWHSHWLGGAP